MAHQQMIDQYNYITVIYSNEISLESTCWRIMKIQENFKTIISSKYDIWKKLSISPMTYNKTLCLKLFL